MKKYLKGFANLGYGKVTENTSEKYSAEKITKIPGAKSCTPTDNRSDYAINADDGVWDSGAEWTDTTNEITIVEADLDTLVVLTGAEITEDEQTAEEGVFDNAPEVALTYSALNASGGYRLFRYYCCKATNYKVTHTTRGESNDAQSYTITFKCTPRKIDGKIRGTKDVDKGESLTFLDSIPSLPEILGA